MENRELMYLAENAKQKSYSPYSKFKVGAALLTKDGKIYVGANIENSSYPLTPNPTENDFIFGLILDAREATIVESIPPDKNVPTSTFATIWCFTELVTTSFISLDVIFLLLFKCIL